MSSGQRLLQRGSRLLDIFSLLCILSYFVITATPACSFSSIQKPAKITRKAPTTAAIPPIHRTINTQIYDGRIGSITDQTENNDVVESSMVASTSENLVYDPNNDDILISNICQGINEIMKSTIIEPVRNYVEIQPGGTAGKGILDKLTAPPEVPGIPGPVWLTILGSVPTALGWYGYYKFSIEEELFQHELQTKKVVSGCGGYGTLFPLVWCILIGFPLDFLGVEAGASIVQLGVIWILLGQINLYRRVNELCSDRGELEGGNTAEVLMNGVLENEPPLHAWWALLPPPLDVVVGLRQVHFLSEYWRITRGEECEKDVIAEELFPFISAKRFTLKEFFRTPSMWFWFTKEWEDFEYEFLKES